MDSQNDNELVINIWTIQMAQWRLAEKMDIALLDTTAKSGVRAFAPDYTDVMLYKQGKMSEEEYTDIYFARLDKSRIVFPDKWEQLKTKPRVAIACYCKAGVFCHRHLFTVAVNEYLRKFGYRVINNGELLATTA